MDAEAMAAGIIDRARRFREEREAERQRREEEQRRMDEYHRRRRSVYVALGERQPSAVDEAVQALLEIGESLNPRGADFWAAQYLDEASQVDSYPHKHFALLIARTAFFDQDRDKLKTLLLKAINTPELSGVGQFLVSELLEHLWARSEYEDTLSNGKPNLEATPFTTVFSSVGEFAKALAGLPRLSRETINRRLKSGELITVPPWTKNSTKPHRFKFVDAPTQREVLAHLRASRTLGTKLPAVEGTTGHEAEAEADISNG
jgi:hypothetical protein